VEQGVDRGADVVLRVAATGQASPGELAVGRRLGLHHEHVCVYLAADLAVTPGPRTCPSTGGHPAIGLTA